MTIAVADTQFRGPYSRLEFLDDRPGVWVVMDGRDPPPLVAGTAQEVRRAVRDHPRRPRWTRRCERPSVAVFYSPLQARRQRILRRLREKYELPGPAGEPRLPAIRHGEGRIVVAAGGSRNNGAGGEAGEAEGRVA